MRGVQVLFAGDHLMFRASGDFGISRFCWYSIPEQLKSVAKVAELDVDILLPGHGRRGYFAGDADRAAKFDAILARGGP